MNEQCEAVLEGFDLAAKATRDQIIEMLSSAGEEGASGSCGVNASDGGPAVLFFAWGSWAPLFQGAIRMAVEQAKVFSSQPQTGDEAEAAGREAYRRATEGE